MLIGWTKESEDYDISIILYNMFKGISYILDENLYIYVHVQPHCIIRQQTQQYFTLQQLQNS